MGYNGVYLEDLLNKGNITMIKRLIEKGSKVKRRFLNPAEINNLRERIDEALNYLKEIDPIRYRTAKKYQKGYDREEMLDLYFAIDNIIHDFENDLLIGVDWTTNKNTYDLLKKIDNHKKLDHCHWLLNLDVSVVVLVINEDAIPKDKTAKFVAKVLHRICKEINKKDFQGGITIDARELMK